MGSCCSKRAPMNGRQRGMESCPARRVASWSKGCHIHLGHEEEVNRGFRARINARGHEQVDGEHCKEDNKAAPVVNDTTFHIVLILMLMAAWTAEVADVKGAFLQRTVQRRGRDLHEGPRRLRVVPRQQHGAVVVANSPPMHFGNSCHWCSRI
jgi:hypothetical protein